MRRQPLPARAVLAALAPERSQEQPPAEVVLEMEPEREVLAQAPAPASGLTPPLRWALAPGPTAQGSMELALAPWWAPHPSTRSACPSPTG
jgi:hypothetical protein